MINDFEPSVYQTWDKTMQILQQDQENKTNFNMVDTVNFWYLPVWKALYLALVLFIANYRDTRLLLKFNLFHKPLYQKFIKLIYIYIHKLYHIISKLVVGNVVTWRSLIKNLNTLTVKKAFILLTFYFID